MSKDYEDLFTTAEWRNYAERQLRSTLPRIKDSDLFVSMGSTGDDPNVRMATELGFAMLLGKPLVFVVEPGQKLPASMMRAADEIVHGEIQHPKTKQKLDEAIARVTAALEKT